MAGWPETLKRVSRFLVIGGLAFVLDAGITGALKQLGLSAYSARVPALGASIVFTFFANRMVTFGLKSRPSFKEFTAYGAASLLGVLINYAIYSGALWVGIDWLWAAAIGTLIASAFNFLIYSRIFRSPSP